MQKVASQPFSAVQPLGDQWGSGNCVAILSAVSNEILANSDGKSLAQWVHFAPFGKWEGHSKGPFEFTREVFDNIVRRFNAIKNDLHVDYNHDSLKTEIPGKKPAAGWIKKLEIRGDGSNPEDGLWGLVKWTPDASEFIRNSEYRYTSPVIDFKSKDRKTGKEVGPELFNAALTNDPFLDGQVPLSFERFSMADNTNASGTEAQDALNILQGIADKCGLGLTDLEAILMSKIDDVVSLVNGAPKEEPKEDEDTMTAQSKEPNPDTQVKLDKWDSVEGKQLIELQRRVKELEDERATERDKEILAHVEKKISEGFIFDNLKNEAIECYKENFERAEKLFSTKLVPLSTTSQAGNKEPEHITLSKNDETVIKNLVSTGLYTRELATKKVLAHRKVN